MFLYVYIVIFWSLHFSISFRRSKKFGYSFRSTYCQSNLSHGTAMFDSSGGRSKGWNQGLVIGVNTKGVTKKHYGSNEKTFIFHPRNDLWSVCLLCSEHTTNVIGAATPLTFYKEHKDQPKVTHTRPVVCCSRFVHGRERWPSNYQEVSILLS